MTYAGIEILTSDDLDIAADRMVDLGPATVECPECRGRGDIWHVSGSAGLINMECPGCLGDGCILDLDPDDEGWEPEPPTPAAPALVPCRDCGGDGTRRM